jgi:hypothetical protein
MAENGVRVPLLNPSMKCSGYLGWHSRSANAISRRGPEQLIDGTTDKITNPLVDHTQAWFCRHQIRIARYCGMTYVLPFVSHSAGTGRIHRPRR